MNEVRDKITRVTGLKPQVVDEIFEEVKANQKKLEGCPRHDFSIEHKRMGSFVRQWRCSKCGGWVEAQSKRWYELGIKHAT